MTLDAVTLLGDLARPRSYWVALLVQAAEIDLAAAREGHTDLHQTRVRVFAAMREVVKGRRARRCRLKIAFEKIAAPRLRDHKKWLTQEERAVEREDARLEKEESRRDKSEPKLPPYQKWHRVRKWGRKMTPKKR